MHVKVVLLGTMQWHFSCSECGILLSVKLNDEDAIIDRFRSRTRTSKTT